MRDLPSFTNLFPSFLYVYPHLWKLIKGIRKNASTNAGRGHCANCKDKSPSDRILSQHFSAYCLYSIAASLS
jgi:hypothetical protein